MVKEEYEDIVKNEVQRAIAADEDALTRLCSNYIDNVKAYTQREKVRNRYTGNYEEPDERLMRSVEEKIDIPEGRKDDFRREIMNYIGALAIDGKKFDYKTNERLQKALELKLFEDQKDTIKLTSLVSNVVDKATQEKIDVVKSRLIRNYGYNESSADRRAELRGQHLRPGPHEEVDCTTRTRSDAERHAKDLSGLSCVSPVASSRLSGESSEGVAVGQKIERDHQRFRKIVRGKVKSNLQQVHQPRRDDRQEGQGPRQHSAAADRHPAVPLRPERLRRRRPGRRASRASRSAARQGEPSGGAGDQPGGHILEVELTHGGDGRHPRRGAGPAAHRAARQEEHRHHHATSTPASARPGPNRCATSSAPSSRP